MNEDNTPGQPTPAQQAAEIRKQIQVAGWIKNALASSAQPNLEQCRNAVTAYDWLVALEASLQQTLTQVADKLPPEVLRPDPAPAPAVAPEPVAVVSDPVSAPVGDDHGA